MITTKQFIGLLIPFLFFVFFLTRTFYSPLLQKTLTNSTLDNILPQGWAFFTKSPRDVRVEMYSLMNSRKVLKANAVLENYFGIIRMPQRVSLEIANLVESIPDSLWVYSNTTDLDFSQGVIVERPVKFRSPVVNEEVVIINRYRLPWAWARFENTAKFPCVYVKVRPLIEDS